MVSKVETQGSKSDGLLWGLALVLLAAGVWQYYFLDQSQLLRFVLLLLGCGVAIGMIAKTAKGQQAWAGWQASIQEVRKVVWPSRQDTVRMSLAVMTMVFIMGLVLWTVDAILIRLIALVTGHGGG